MDKNAEETFQPGTVLENKWIIQGEQKEKPTAGLVDAARLTEERPALRRFPWEGFSDVGFRTALPVVIE